MWKSAWNRMEPTADSPISSSTGRGCQPLIRVIVTEAEAEAGSQTTVLSKEDRTLVAVMLWCLSQQRGTGRGNSSPPYPRLCGHPHSFSEACSSWRGARVRVGGCLSGPGRQLGPFLACLMPARPSRNGVAWIPAWGEGAHAREACGASRPGLLDLKDTWSLPSAQAPPGYRPLLILRI